MSFENWLANFERLTICHLYPDAVAQEICDTSVSKTTICMAPCCVLLLIDIGPNSYYFELIVQLLFVFGLACYLRVWSIALEFQLHPCFFLNFIRLET